MQENISKNEKRVCWKINKKQTQILTLLGVDLLIE